MAGPGGPKIEIYVHPDIVDGQPLVSEAKSAELLRRLVDITHGTDGFDRAKYVELIQEIGDCYHLVKGASEFYENVLHERNNDGEYFCDLYKDKEGILIFRLRIQPESGVIIISSVYAEAEDFPVLTKPDVDNIRLMISVITSFISRSRLQRTLKNLAFKDDMGFPNFRMFIREVVKYNEMGRLPGMTAVHFDLHNFTMVNNDIGRRNSDMVMKNYYGMLCEAAGDEGVFVRLGGDKFLGLFSQNVKDRIFDILRGAAVPYGEDGDHKVFLCAGVGVYDIPSDFVFNSHQDIMDATMMASMVAKRREDGAIVFYDKSMEIYKNRMKQFQIKFREALQREDFKLMYQPKVEVETGRIIGAEALSRWISDGKLMLPKEFVPLLEQNTDICDLDFYVLDHSCADIRRRMDEGKSIVRVSVNFSRKHLLDLNLLDRIIEIIDRHEVPHEYVEIELTETTTDVQFRDLKRIVTGLKDAGIHVAVDDFGVGYSSMNLIREIPWDVLKVDRCFLPDDNVDERTRKATLLMFRHVVAMVHELGMECVVEGVETQKQLDLLKENKCQIAQGYFFDKPMTPDEFEKKLDIGHY